MSVTWCNQDGWILCHSSFLHDLFKSVAPTPPCSACGNYAIFHIGHQFMRRDQKKTAKNSEISYRVSEADDEDEVIRIKKHFTIFVDEAKRLGKWFPDNCTFADRNNEVAVNAAKYVLRETEHTKDFLRFHGANINPYSIAIDFGKEKYLIPPNCTFYCCDVFEIRNKLADLTANRFDVVVLDPPWRNKHVRRKNLQSPRDGYNLIREFDMVSLPIDDLLSSDGLLVVWCTNSKQQINYLLEKMFPAWNVCYVSSWYWIKVTESGEPICEFSNRYGKKQPFERIIFGCRKCRLTKYKSPESNKLIVSTPSSIHSHKPPLSNVLVNYIPSDARCLELFARYLVPGWVSCGDEVLKLQHNSLFK